MKIVAGFQFLNSNRVGDRCLFFSCGVLHRKMKSMCGKLEQELETDCQLKVRWPLRPAGFVTPVVKF